ncbi:unnamed protein product [Ceutorhynchus assimilis]|uniref:Lipase domain-containing protein n=1 Tax=Ceutorhynchus assimilis TaxID=467358 RepID=A0A9N9Q7X5_9CUCU|nr:unnamed protein product [Ceutorhynchus assimilis]
MKYLWCFSLAFICLLVRGEAKINPGDVSFIYYSKHHRNGYFLNHESDLHKVFNRQLPTIVLVHGWQDNYEADSNSFVRDAILLKLDANIIKVDWSPLSEKGYFTARDAVPFVGRLAAKLLDNISNKFGYSLRRVTMVGFSLGAHVCATIGKTLNGKIGVLTALDPAGPFISPTDRNYCVHKTDAQYVQVIHTNGGTLGMSAPIGHSDFYPNGGSRQPGCGLDLLGGCSHNRAWEYFAESINNNTFFATRCDSWRNYADGSCRGERRLMGSLKTVDVFAKGTFYLTTNSAPPYGQH